MVKPDENIRVYGIVTMGERGQIVIPKEAREELEIGPKEKLLVLGGPNKSIVITRAEQVREFATKLLGAFGREDVRASGKNS